MRVFLDTNVLVSAYATRGLSADVLRLVLAEQELVTGEIVLEELRRVLREKIGLPERSVTEALSVLREYDVQPTVEGEAPVEVNDPSDAVVLATALQAEAEVLVTGDQDLLTVSEEVKRLKIMDPRSFWRHVRS